MAQNPISATIATHKVGSVYTQKQGTVGNSGDLIVGAGVPVYYEAAYAATSGLIMSPSAVTTSAGLATTYVGLCLSNAAGSTVNLVLQRVAGSFIVATSTITMIGLITGYAAGGITVHTTALTPFNALIGTGAVPVAKADSAATLVGTPLWTMTLAQAAASSTTAFNVDLQGGIIIPPGGYAAIGTSIAGPASGFQGSFEWLELPV